MVAWNRSYNLWPVVVTGVSNRYLAFACLPGLRTTYSGVHLTINRVSTRFAGQVVITQSHRTVLFFRGVGRRTTLLCKLPSPITSSPRMLIHGNDKVQPRLGWVLFAVSTQSFIQLDFCVEGPFSCWMSEQGCHVTYFPFQISSYFSKTCLPISSP